MTTKTISKYHSGAYTLSSRYSELRITSTGGFGEGVYAPSRATISNAGKINGFSYYAIVLGAGGDVINQQTGLIGNAAGKGIYLTIGGNVTNYGTILASWPTIILNGGGTITNGSYAAPDALIRGGQIEVLGGGTLSNLGTILAYVIMDGKVTNGAAGDTTASMSFVDLGFGTVANFGTITGGNLGVDLGAGAVNNGAATDTKARIEGASGVAGPSTSSSAVTVTNFGVIDGTGAAHGGYGVKLNHGGSLTNGTANDQSALVEGYTGASILGAVGTVANFGTIQGEGAAAGERGLYFKAGGVVTNGAATDINARIEGRSGVVINIAVPVRGGVTVTNFGVIDGTGAAHGAYGVRFINGGGLANGTASHRSALVEGYTGVSVLGVAGAVTNFGTIKGDGVSTVEGGVYLKAGGRVTNGGPGDTAALIEGANGVVLAAAGTIANYGGIVGTTAHGALLKAGGAITNGGGADLSALIEGYSRGAETFGGAGTVKNFGTIQATGGASAIGVFVALGGVVTNGSLDNGAALIEGYTGLNLAGTAAATNFGTIWGRGLFGGYGAVVGGGDSLTNGAVGHANALIEGFEGVEATGTGNTVTNFGTILGAGGSAVAFNSATDVLVVEAGCAFVGAVSGGAGTLDLDTGVGTLTGLLAGGSVTVSGSMAPTTFTNFGTVEIGAAAQFTSSGSVTIAAGQALVDAGSLTLGGGKASITNAGLIETTGSGNLTVQGAVTNTGTLAVNGGALTVTRAVTGSGSATINGGTLDFTSTFNENVTFTGTTGILELAKSQTYTGTVSGFSKAGGTSLDLTDIGFVSSGEATFSGTSTSGTLTVTDGVHTAHIKLMGDYRTSTFIAASDGHGGVIIHDPAKAPTPPPPWIEAGAGQRFIAAMAGFGADRGGPAQVANDAHFARPALLSVPRMAMA